MPHTTSRHFPTILTDLQLPCLAPHIKGILAIETSLLKAPPKPCLADNSPFKKKLKITETFRLVASWIVNKLHNNKACSGCSHRLLKMISKLAMQRSLAFCSRLNVTLLPQIPTPYEREVVCMAASDPILAVGSQNHISLIDPRVKACISSIANAEHNRGNPSWHCIHQAQIPQLKNLQKLRMVNSTPCWKK